MLFFFTSIIAALILIYLGFLILVSILSVYPPRIPVFLSPGQLGDPQEPITFETLDNIRLKGWWVEGGRSTVIICFHGFLGNRCEWVPYSTRFRAMGASLMFPDHRCHGYSDRSKCTFGISEAQDVVAAVDYACKRCPGCKIVLLGSSMGGTAVARAVAENPGLADAVILDGSYANLDEAARGFWYVTGFKSIAMLMSPSRFFGRLFLGFSLKSIDMIATYSRFKGTPSLFLYGDSDMVVPFLSAKKCVEAAKGTAVWFEGSGHAQARYNEPSRYFEAIADFLKEHKLLESPMISTSFELETIKTDHKTV